jgi:hypothetical protein
MEQNIQNEEKEKKKFYKFENNLKNPSIQPFKQEKLLVSFSIIILVK